MAKNLSMLLVLAATGESGCTFKDYGIGATYGECPSRSGSTHQLGFFCKKREYTTEDCWGFGGAPGCKSGDIELKTESCGWWGQRRTCADISQDWGCGCGNTGSSCGCQCIPRRRAEVEEPKEVQEEPQQRTSLEGLAQAIVGEVGGIDSQVLAEFKDSLRPENESETYLDLLMQLAAEAGESENENQ